MYDLAYAERPREQVFEEAQKLTVEDFIEREQDSGIKLGPYHQSWLMEKAPEKVLRYLQKAYEQRQNDRLILGARQGFASMDVVDVPPSSFTAINTTTTESCLWNNTVTTALQTTWAPIPAWDMKAGKVYHVRAGGTIAIIATPTVIWTPRVGPNATAANAANLSMGASPTITTVASLNHPFFTEFTMGVRSIGLTASLATTVGSGYAAFGNASATATVAVMGGTIPTTVDNTVLTGLLINLTWGTSNASNTCTCTWVTMQSFN